MRLHHRLLHRQVENYVVCVCVCVCFFLKFHTKRSSSSTSSTTSCSTLFRWSSTPSTSTWRRPPSTTSCSRRCCCQCWWYQGLYLGGSCSKADSSDESAQLDQGLASHCAFFFFFAKKNLVCRFQTQSCKTLFGRRLHSRRLESCLWIILSWKRRFEVQHLALELQNTRRVQNM